MLSSVFVKRILLMYETVFRLKRNFKVIILVALVIINQLLLTAVASAIPPIHLNFRSSIGCLRYIRCLQSRNRVIK